MTLRQYWQASRAPRYSVLFAVPLFLLYEGFAFALTGSETAGVRNGADVLLKTAFLALGGPHGIAFFNFALVLFGAVIVWRDWRGHRGPLEGRVFLGMVLESLVYAALLGVVVSRLTVLLLHPRLGIALAAQGSGPPALSLAQNVVISLGAGIYEELVFRVLLVSAIMAMATAFHARRSVAVAVAVIGSAIIFSAFHYVGIYGDRWTLASFTFRAIAGVLLSGLYVARGFGVTAWSHALYDIGLTMLM